MSHDPYSKCRRCGVWHYTRLQRRCTDARGHLYGPTWDELDEGERGSLVAEMQATEREAARGGDRQARTIRRLRALADGYRARLASLPTGDATDNAMATMHETEHAGHASLPEAALWGQGRDAGIKAERARIVARLRELVSELRAEAETHGDTVFGTVAAVQEKTIEGLVSIIEKSKEP